MPLDHYLTDDSCNRAYYIEAPNGKVYPCGWVQYEQAKALGYVHRILTEKVAVLHKLKRKGM